MIGRRVKANEGERGIAYLFEKGDYGYNDFVKIWYAMTPNGHLANLSNHKITEHDDGTITVSPSIRVLGDLDYAYHGYLEKGIWRDA